MGWSGWLDVLLGACCEGLWVFGSGAVDSLRFDRAVSFLWRSRTVCMRLKFNVVLNGGVVLGAFLAVKYVVGPLLELSWRALPHIGSFVIWCLPRWCGNVLSVFGRLVARVSPDGLMEGVGSLLSQVPLLTVVYPLYLGSLVLNTVWCQEVADNALFMLSSCRSHPTLFETKPLPLFHRLVHELYRSLLNLLWLGQMYSLQFLLPSGRANAFVYFLHLSLMVPLYSFEYRLSFLRWPVELRLRFFEGHWLYFLGFGAPLAALSMWAGSPNCLGSRIGESAAMALAFPLVILTSSVSDPVALGGGAWKGGGKRSQRGEGTRGLSEDVDDSNESPSIAPPSRDRFSGANRKREGSRRRVESEKHRRQVGVEGQRGAETQAENVSSEGVRSRIPLRERERERKAERGGAGPSMSNVVHEPRKKGRRKVTDRVPQVQQSGSPWFSFSFSFLALPRRVPFFWFAERLTGTLMRGLKLGERRLRKAESERGRERGLRALKETVEGEKGGDVRIGGKGLSFLRQQRALLMERSSGVSAETAMKFLEGAERFREREREYEGEGEKEKEKERDGVQAGTMKVGEGEREG